RDQAFCSPMQLRRHGGSWNAAIASAAWSESAENRVQGHDQAVCFEPEKYLHAKELRYFRALEHNRPRKSYLLGRVAAKRALACCASIDDATEIEVQAGIFGQPIVCSALCWGFEVSISHMDEFGLAIAFPAGHSLGLDIEACDRMTPEVVKG